MSTDQLSVQNAHFIDGYKQPVVVLLKLENVA